MDHSIVIINDTSEEKHWGCQAAGGTVLNTVKMLHGVSEVKRWSVQFSWQFKPCPLTLEEAVGLVDSNHQDLNDVIETIHETSLVVVNAEGTLLSNRPPVRNILMFLIAAIHAGTPFAIVNATIDPFCMKVGTDRITQICEMYQHVLPHAFFVTVRDATSYQFARESGATNVWHGYDASLGIFSKAKVGLGNLVHRRNEGSVHLCLVFGTALLTKHRRTYILKVFLQKLKECLPIKYIVCSMDPREQQYLAEISREVGARLVTPDTMSTEKLIRLFQGASLCISGRYHGCLLSASQHVPFLHYETHSNRVTAFCRHLCYRWGEIKIFNCKPIDKEVRIAQEVWCARHKIRNHLEREMPFLLRKSRIHEKLIVEMWDSLRKGEAVFSLGPASKMDAVSAFRKRARIAAEMLVPNLRIADIGGFIQIFGGIYPFQDYVSFDRVKLLDPEDRTAGQPDCNNIAVETFPFPDAHVECDLDQESDFSRIAGFDVAVLLGVLPWLKDWQSLLRRLDSVGIEMFLISWDEIELDRIAVFLDSLGFKEIDRRVVSDKSRIGLFVRIN